LERRSQTGLEPNRPTTTKPFRTKRHLGEIGAEEGLLETGPHGQRYDEQLVRVLQVPERGDGQLETRLARAASLASRFSETASESGSIKPKTVREKPYAK